MMNNADGEKQSFSEYILKVESTEFANTLDIGYKTEVSNMTPRF